MKTVGTLFPNMTFSGAPLELDQVSALIRRFMAWIRAGLVSWNAEDWSPYVYPIFILQDATPKPTKKGLEGENQILLKVVLPSLPPELRFTEATIEKVFSHDLGYLESEFYRFSPYGAFLYSSSYPRLSSYIDEVIVPIIGRFRQSQATLETLNGVLDSRIGKLSRSANITEGFRTIAELRESVLSILSETDFGQVFKQRAEASESLVRIFGVRTMEGAIQRKVDILNSIIDSINQRQIQKAADASARTNLLLTFIGLALAAIGVILAIPHL